MRIPTAIVGFVGFGTLVFRTALAHHGAFEYDLGTVVRYEGVIVEQHWRNPHSLTVLETVSRAGKPIRLEIEGAGPSSLRPVGVTAAAVVVGERVTAVVSPSRRHPDQSAYGIELIKTDGSVVPLSRSDRGAHAARDVGTASSIFGTWTAELDAFSGLLSSRGTWAFTAEGRRALDTYSPAMSSQAECVPVSAPWLMVHPVIHEIAELSDRVVIRSDWMGAERTIYLDGRAHPPKEQRFQQGHSIGRWEGDVLVVDTTNFVERIYAGVASSDRKHLVERFSLGDDGASLSYSFVLEDPRFLAQPVTGMYLWEYRPDLDSSGVECDRELAERYLREFR